MHMQNKRLMLATLALGALSMPGLAGGAEVVGRGFGFTPPKLEPRQSAYRKGRRWNYGMGLMPNGNNPPGTKLAKKMAKGTLTICGIR
jgi:hypothetical protein